MNKVGFIGTTVLIVLALLASTMFVVDQRQFGQRKLRYTGAGVNQDIVIDEHRGCTQVAATNATTAAENSDFHDVFAGSSASRGRDALILPPA